MKTVLCTLAVCLLLAATLFTTQTLVREEGRRTRTALSKTLDARPDASPPDDALAKRLDALNSQFDAFSRRVTALEEALAASAAQNDKAAQNTRADLAALRQEMKGFSAAQARFNVVPGYLAELTGYLEKSFAHVEETVAENAPADALTATLNDLAQRLDAVESLFVPLYEFFGLSQDPAALEFPSVDARLQTLAEQTDIIRRDVEVLRIWAVPRNFDPDKLPQPR